MSRAVLVVIPLPIAVRQQACQHADWDVIHHLECSRMITHHAALKADGFRLNQAASHTFWFTSDLFGSFQENYEGKIEPHKDALDAGRLIYFNENVDAPDMNGVVPVHKYRREAESRVPWSPVCFEVVVGFVRRTSGTRLVAFVDPCGDAKLHLLCIQFLGTKEFKLVPVMAQIEYI
ncbi:hypothetical protein BKA70DRAFT_1429966 [Coprinopsis sp. MPI-PUGE-AT-0042]|nr:hypothetical protein BKA70DRAFT_1429966 [Coprinopsis sp. MPI-PUGE-AT-0042]